MRNDFISFYHISLSLKSHLNEIFQTYFKYFSVMDFVLDQDVCDDISIILSGIAFA